MGFNQDASAKLERMGKMLELLGENRFRVNAYANAARAIEQRSEDLSEIAGDESALTEIEGIGKGTAEKLAELASTGRIEELEELEKQVPAGLLEVMDIPGVGPKTAKALWETLDIRDVEGLRAALDDGRILDVPRVGEKAAQKIRENLSFAEQSGKRLHLGLAQPIAERLVERLGAVEGVERIAYAGSLRRGKETIGDVDLLCVASDPGAVADAFCDDESVVQVIGRGETKCSVRVKIEGAPARWKGYPADQSPSVQADLRIVPEASWGAALMYFTGSKEHNVRLRERAQKRGMTLNEYGLYELDDSGGAAEGDPVAGRTEEEVYKALGLAWIPPELRENRGEFDRDPPEDLISLGAIAAELHAHTTESDGRLSLEELVRQAIDRGFHTIAVTDHSRSSAQAGGLDVERLEQQRESIDKARARFGDAISILHGCEVDIHADGSLDFEDDILFWLDWVVASPHTALDQPPKKATERLVRAVSHPAVHVLGHPTGRIIERRKGLEPAMDEVYAAAAEHETALEINAHWLRLDLRDTQVDGAVRAGCLIAIDCDVHAAENFDNLRFGVETARRGGLTTGRCLNSWDRDRLEAWRAASR